MSANRSPAGRIAIRPARWGDRDIASLLLYESDAAGYDRLAGGRANALAGVSKAFGRPGNTVSAEVVTVAELNARVVAVLAGFPAPEVDRRERSFLRTVLAHSSPRRWPGTLRLSRVARAATPVPLPDSFYVDAVATVPRCRRSGAARALLCAAERRAAELGLSFVALDTTASNIEARALYENQGFEATELRHAVGDRPAMVAYAKRVGPVGGWPE